METGEIASAVLDGVHGGDLPSLVLREYDLF